MRVRGWLLVLGVGAASAFAGEAPETPAAVESAAAESAPAAQARAAASPDPWQGFNRAVFRFNDELDRYVAKPLARGYRQITPRRLRAGITNFYLNLSAPVVILNDLLQGKPRAAGHDTFRFLMNSSWGLAGFIDVGSRMGVPPNDEDFGQTLGKWGVGAGPYLVLPLLGPSSVRDGLGYGVDVASNPRTWMTETEVNVAIAAGGALNTRTNLLEVEDIVQGDRYLFIRDLYLQRRAYLVNDGRVDSDPFLDDSEETEEGEAAAPAPDEAASAPDEAGEDGAATPSSTPAPPASADDNSAAEEASF